MLLPLTLFQTLWERNKVPQMYDWMDVSRRNTITVQELLHKRFQSTLQDMNPQCSLLTYGRIFQQCTNSAALANKPYCLCLWALSLVCMSSFSNLQSCQRNSLLSFLCLFFFNYHQLVQCVQRSSVYRPCPRKLDIRSITPGERERCFLGHFTSWFKPLITFMFHPT